MFVTHEFLWAPVMILWGLSYLEISSIDFMLTFWTYITSGGYYFMYWLVAFLFFRALWSEFYGYLEKTVFIVYLCGYVVLAVGDSYFSYVYADQMNTWYFHKYGEWVFVLEPETEEAEGDQDADVDEGDTIIDGILSGLDGY